MALTAKDRRALRVLTLVVLPLFGIAYGVRPVARAIVERSEQRAQQHDLLVRERTAVAEATHVDSALFFARLALAGESEGLLKGPARAAIMSDLTDRVRSLARQQDVLVLQLTELPADSIGDCWSMLRIAMRAESDLAGVARMLRGLERDVAHLRVSRILIERPDAGFGGGGPAASDGRQVLTMNFTIETLVLDDVRVGSDAP